MNKHVAVTDEGDDEVAEWLIASLQEHYRTLFKAPLIALMIGFSVAFASGSVLKAIFVAAVCCIAALFSTWRRYLEPLCFWLFIATVAVWCDSAFFNRVATAISAVTVG